MKCILIRLDANTFIDISHDWYHVAFDIFGRTKIIDLIGKMLCIKVKPTDSILEVFGEYINAEIGYIVDSRNHGKEEYEVEEYWSDHERLQVLEYFLSCYKFNLPFVPDAGYLKFMACVWHEDHNFVHSWVCLVAEHSFDGEDISETEPGDSVRESLEGDRADRRYLSAVFK